MKYVNQNDAFIVQVEKHDVEQFNEEEKTNLPTDKIIVFGFRKNSGDLIRVEPKWLRSGGTAWERLRDRARAFGMEIVHP